MIFSIFYRLIPSRIYKIIINKNKSKFLITLNFYIEFEPIRRKSERQIFNRKIKNGTFNLNSKEKTFYK